MYFFHGLFSEREREREWKKAILLIAGRDSVDVYNSTTPQLWWGCWCVAAFTGLPTPGGDGHDDNMLERWNGLWHCSQDPSTLQSSQLPLRASAEKLGHSQYVVDDLETGLWQSETLHTSPPPCPHTRPQVAVRRPTTTFLISMLSLKSSGLSC